MNRKRRPLGKASDEVAVSRQEFEELRESVDRIHRGLARGMSIRPVVSTDPLVDDSYEIFFDGSVGRADTVETITDGAAPGSSPTPTVRGGPRWLCIEWAAVANADLTRYEVHIGTSAGFATSAATLAADMAGTLVFVRSVNGTELAYGTDYYVKLIAKDDDGSAAVGGEVGPTQLDPNGTDDFLAGSVTAEKLAAVIAMASKFIAGIDGAERFEFGVMDDDTVAFRAWGSDGAGGYVKTFEIDSSGQVLLRGQVYFGTGSRLMPDDIIEIAEQNSDFQVGSLVQQQAYSNGSGSVTNGSEWLIEWPSPTTDGNLLVFVIAIRSQININNPRAITDDSNLTAAGWVQAAHITSGDLRLYVYILENAPSQTETPTYTLGTGSALRQHHKGYEFSGVSVEDVAAVVASGTADEDVTETISVGPTATTTQEDGLLLEIDVVGDDVDSLFGHAESGWWYSGQMNSADELQSTLFFRRLDSSNNSPLSAFSASHDIIRGGDVTDVVSPVDWVSALLSFKAKVADVGTPAAGKVRLYAKDVVGESYLHVKDEAGKESAVVLGDGDEIWRFEYVTVTEDFASNGQHSGSAPTVLIPGLQVGDLCFWIGVDSVTDAPAFHFFTRPPVCTVAGEITLQRFNADSVVRDLGSGAHHFLVIHRS